MGVIHILGDGKGKIKLWNKYWFTMKRNDHHKKACLSILPNT